MIDFSKLQQGQQGGQQPTQVSSQGMLAPGANPNTPDYFMNPVPQQQPAPTQTPGPDFGFPASAPNIVHMSDRSTGSPYLQMLQRAGQTPAGQAGRGQYFGPTLPQAQPLMQGGFNPFNLFSPQTMFNPWSMNTAWGGSPLGNQYSPNFQMPTMPQWRY